MKRNLEIPLALRGLRQERGASANFAAKANNLRRTDEGTWAECRGTRQIDADLGQRVFTGASAVGAVETMATLSQHAGRRRFLVFELLTTPSASSLNLVYWDGSQQTYVNIVGDRQHRVGPWEGTQYAEIDEWLYFLNGYDQAERWNGRYHHRIGFDGPASRPQVTFENGAESRDYIYGEYVLTGDTPSTNGLHRLGVGPWTENIDSTGATAQVYLYLPWTYAYVVTYLNDLGYESPPSPVSIVSGVNRGADLKAGEADEDADGRTGPTVEIPNAPTWAKGWRLWRTRNMYGLDAESQLAQEFYLHTESQSRVGTTLADLKPDEQLGRTLDRKALGPFPTKARRIGLYQNRTYVSGHDANKLRYSPPGLYEQFPEQNELVIGGASSGAIVGQFVTRSVLLVFTERGVHMVRDVGQGEPQVQTIHEHEGLAAPRGVCEVPGAGVAFISQDGPRLLVGGDAGIGTGTDVSVIELGASDEFGSSGIRDAWVKVNRGALIRAQVVVNTTDREVWFMVPVNGAVRPNHAFVWHYETKDWTERPYWPFNCAVEVPDHVRPIFLGGLGASDDTRGVHVYTSQVETIAGAARTALYRSQKNVIEQIDQRYDVRHLVVRGQTLGAQNITIAYWTDRRTQQVADDLTLDQRDREDESRPEWGTDVWSASAYWSDYDATEIRQAIDTRHSGMGFQFEIATMARFRLDRVLLHVLADQLSREQGDEA